MKVTVFDKYNYRNFFSENGENKSYVYMIERWLKSKERTLPCYKVFGFDDQGFIYIRYKLPYQDRWLPLNATGLEVLNEYI